MTKKQKQQHEFSLHFFNSDAATPELQVAIEWIKKNLSPDEVFSRDALKIWCSENEGYLENKYPVTE